MQQLQSKAIAIQMNAISDGYGDYISSLKLAKSLQEELGWDVVLYTDKPKIVDSLLNLEERINVGIKNENGKIIFDGIEIRCMQKAQLLEEISHYPIAIYSSLLADNPIDINDLLLSAKFNIYLQEYDCDRNINVHNLGAIRPLNKLEQLWLPREIRSNTMFEDASGRQHTMLTTGFDSEALGIHIEKGVRSAVPSLDWKQQMLSQFILPLEIKQRAMQSSWTLTYYAKYEDFGMYSEGCTQMDSYLHSLIKSIKMNKPEETKVTIFDTSRFEEQYLQYDDMYIHRFREPCNHIYLLSNGEVKIYEASPRAKKVFPDIHGFIDIIHIGPQPQQRFRELLQYSELPVAITGDSSLAEAISMNKLFFHNAPPWKMLCFANYVALATELLPWQQASKIMELFGCDPVDPQKVASLEEASNLYVIYNEELKQAFCEQELDQLERKNHSYLSYYLEKNIRQKTEESKKLLQEVSKNRLAFEIGLCYRKSSLDLQLKQFRQRYVFGSLTGRYNTPKYKLFSDQSYQEAMYAMNERVIQSKNLVTNLANIIRDTERSVEN